MREDRVLQQVTELLSAAERVAVLTGAGMSAASGLPTYRGIGGLYNDIEIEQGMPIEEILHARTLVRDPALCWKYVAQIGAACRTAKPNAGHQILADWQSRCDLNIITQNVDGFHTRAGSKQVIELHGNLNRLFCLDCSQRFEPNDFDYQILPPRCPHCDGLVRPDAVLFGESLPAKAVQAYDDAFARGFDLIIAIGTTAGFPYIFEPIVTAANAGVATVEINPDATALSEHVGWYISMPAVEALQGINEMWTSGLRA